MKHHGIMGHVCAISEIEVIVSGLHVKLNKGKHDESFLVVSGIIDVPDTVYVIGVRVWVRGQ